MGARDLFILNFSLIYCDEISVLWRFSSVGITSVLALIGRVSWQVRNVRGLGGVQKRLRLSCDTIAVEFPAETRVAGQALRSAQVWRPPLAKSPNNIHTVFLSLLAVRTEQLQCHSFQVPLRIIFLIYLRQPTAIRTWLKPQ